MTRLLEGPVTEELTIRGLSLMLKRRLKIIASVTGACFGLAILICVVMTPRYEATGEIQLQKSSSDGLRLEAMTNAAAGDSDALDASLTLQTQASILESDTLALKVIEKLSLEGTRDFKPIFNPISWVLGALSPSGPNDPGQVALEEAPRRRTQVLKVFSKHLKIKPVSGTRLIEITYLSSDRTTAARVVNELIASLVDYTVQVRNKSTNEASEWLSAQLADLKKQAELKQSKVAQLQHDAGVFSLGSADANGKELSYNATLDRLQQATLALSTATSNRIIKGGVYEMVKKGDPELISGLAGSSLAGASPGVNNSFNLLQSLRGQQAALQTQVATDTSKYGSANPKLADERASLASLNDQIKEEVSRIGERAGNDFHAAQVVERDQQAVFEKQRRAADKLNDKAIGYTIASEDAADSRQLYETLYSRLKEAGVMEGLHSSNITVVDPGRVPAKPVRPNVPLYLAVSLCAGAFLGTCGAFFAEATDDRIQNLEMLEETLHTPILAVLPKVNKALPKKIGPKQIGSGFTTSTDRRITALEVPNSAFVEALRGLRTALMHSKRGFAPKVILVTSAAEDEGKSTVSLNLAAVLVQNDARVLLVEADMRHPALSRLFHFDNSNVIGLSNILSGSRQQPQLECFSELPNLSLLPAGPVASSPSELLGARGLRTLIEQWSAAYDYVIIDSPPILPVTDALILSRLAQLTLLVVRQGVSTRANLKRAYRMLVEDDSSHVGVVLNGIGQDSGYYRYKGSKYYTEA